MVYHSLSIRTIPYTVWTMRLVVTCSFHLRLLQGSRFVSCESNPSRKRVFIKLTRTFRQNDLRRISTKSRWWFNNCARFQGEALRSQRNRFSQILFCLMGLWGKFSVGKQQRSLKTSIRLFLCLERSRFLYQLQTVAPPRLPLRMPVQILMYRRTLRLF